mmetsp:Transcript_19081/g.24636  ORF Transcript_19081/g.24636 Transcript_19081/m.24636 type:complete len:285 (-) Transcript_19081:81-935(-)
MDALPLLPEIPQHAIEIHKQQSETLIEVVKNAQKAEQTRQNRLQKCRTYEERQRLEKRWNRERRAERDKIRVLTEESQAVLKAAIDGQYGWREKFLEDKAKAQSIGASAPSLRSMAQGAMGSSQSNDATNDAFFSTQGVEAMKTMYKKIDGPPRGKNAALLRAQAQEQARTTQYLHQARGSKRQYDLQQQRKGLLGEKRDLLCQLHNLVSEEERLIRQIPSTGSTMRSGFSSGSRSAPPFTARSTMSRASAYSSVSKNNYYSCEFNLPKGRDVPRPNNIPQLKM